MVGESWNVFTKRVPVEKHISNIMCKNTPSAEVHECPYFGQL